MSISEFSTTSEFEVPDKIGYYHVGTSDIDVAPTRLQEETTMSRVFSYQCHYTSDW